MNWTIATEKDWSHLEKEFDWVADMQHVPQDSIHHAEGNVAIHTRLVLEALVSFPEYKALTTQQQEIVWAAALLHDVEKRSTTVLEDNGRITSRGHAKKGEYTARTILYSDVATPFHLREQVAALVRYHGLPLWVMDKSNPVKALLEASLRVEMPLLYLLAKADACGRLCADPQDLLERVELFKAFCEEQQCWTTPRSFDSGMARFVYFHKEDSSPEYVPFNDLKGQVIMLAGLPGMGKDRYISKHCADLPVVSLDTIRRQHKLKPDDASATGWVVQEAKEQARVMLRKGQPFVWNATNITRQMRSQWIDLFASYKAPVKLVYIEVPHNEWLRQNKEREHPVPTNVLYKLFSKLEIPAPYEAHEVEYIA